jgi:MoaA/NifB/PqqE/SkfB family radical SAM enzyme
MEGERQARIDKKGRLILPRGAFNGFPMSAGDRFQIEEDRNGIRLRPLVARLAKVYVEPTNACNLNCRTCIRNVWDEPIGQMSLRTFARIFEGLRGISPPPTVIFGGFGEPLAHPRIVDMVEQAKTLRAHTEIITNGTLLTEVSTRALIDAGLDMLWVSLDGARPESYADIRLGAELDAVIANIERFRALRAPRQHPVPEIGVVFVAMKRNIGDLPDVLSLSQKLGVSRFMVTNIWPHTDELREEILYSRTLGFNDCLGSAVLSTLKVPKMGLQEWAREPLYQVICGNWNMRLTGSKNDIKGNHCQFIEDNALAVAWDGGVSPCLPLLHSSEGYLNRINRFNKRWILGNIAEYGLMDLWKAEEHVAFRQRVQSFNFAPCAICDGFPQSETNAGDCFGNTFPTCGGCLWAWGIIQCP